MMTIGETRSVGWKFLALYAFGYTGIWVALLTPVLVSIALKLRQLSPGSAVQDLALVLSVGAVVAIVSNPIFGHLSDRTRSRFGRRRPWLLAGMFCGTLALVIGLVIVNLVQPGPIDTDMNPADSPWADAMRARMPLGTYGTGEDIAAMVGFLAGDESKFITGSMLTVDGGFNA